MSVPSTNVCIDNLQAGRSIQALGGRAEIVLTEGQDTTTAPRPRDVSPSRNVSPPRPPTRSLQTRSISPPPTRPVAGVVSRATRAVKATAPYSMASRSRAVMGHTKVNIDKEWRVVVIALCVFVGAAMLPFFSSLAMLFDSNYVFWVGHFFPVLLLSIVVAMGVTLVVTFKILHRYGPNFYYQEQTLVLIACIFTALLGVVLVLISLPQSKELYEVASHIGHGCSTSNKNMNLLTDYSQVLYQIRAQPSCRGQDSVSQCQGWDSNKYTRYLEYVENEFQCGPICPDVPMPVNEALYLVAPAQPIPPAPPPPAGEQAQEEESAEAGEAGEGGEGGEGGDGGNFLQGHRVGHRRQVTKHRSIARGAAVMPALGQHGKHASAMQVATRANQTHASKYPLVGALNDPDQKRAMNLFSQGTTRTSCSALVATRLQVLAWCFGDVMFWEGLALMVVSLMMSFFSFLDQCLYGRKQ